jgi:hypothetical protein
MAAFSQKLFTIQRKIWGVVKTSDRSIHTVFYCAFLFSDVVVSNILLVGKKCNQKFPFLVFPFDLLSDVRVLAGEMSLGKSGTPCASFDIDRIIYF